MPLPETCIGPVPKQTRLIELDPGIASSGAGESGNYTTAKKRLTPLLNFFGKCNDKNGQPIDLI